MTEPAPSTPAPNTRPPTTPPPPMVLDCLGQRCPLPVIAAAKALPGLAVGAELVVLADDPAAAVDLPAWCRMRGQEWLGAGVDELGRPAYRIRKRV